MSPSTIAAQTGKGLPSPPPSTVIDLRLAVLPFNCRLPISTPDGQGAFISLTQGNVSFDPNGRGGHYYDRAFSKWLPVGRDAVSPDGTHYAYSEIGQGEFVVHIVDVATGQDRVLHESSSSINGQPFVLDYSPEGIYLGNAFEHLLGGLWRLDPSNGSLRHISDVAPISISPGAVWIQTLNPADPNPVETRSSAGTLADEIDRVDLATGKSVTWFYRPGKGVWLLGFDMAGHPLFESSLWGIDVGAEMFVAPNSTTQKLIYKGGIVQSMSGAIADAHGIWIGSLQGIYLYSEAAGLQKVSNQPGFPANGCF